MRLPEPLTVPWSMKPLSSARTEVVEHRDGRVSYSIEHDVLRGVTPAMLVWWLNHMDGTVEVGGAQVPRYRAWHPRDHVALTYQRAATDGRRFGPGAQVRIQEFFNRRPEFAVDVVSTVLFLDESGFAHEDRVLGEPIGGIRYRFTAVPGGTRYEDTLTVGAARAPLRWINRPLQRLLFPREQGLAWLTHNVEEVGNLEHFLPALYRAHHGG